jgi:hypothetical protein
MHNDKSSRFESVNRILLSHQQKMRLTFDTHPPGTLLPPIERLQTDQGTHRTRANTGTGTEA